MIGQSYILEQEFVLFVKLAVVASVTVGALIAMALLLRFFYVQGGWSWGRAWRYRLLLVLAVRLPVWLLTEGFSNPDKWESAVSWKWARMDAAYLRGWWYDGWDAQWKLRDGVRGRTMLEWLMRHDEDEGGC